MVLKLVLVFLNILIDCSLSAMKKADTVNSSPTREISLSKAARSVYPRWTNLILDGMNRDKGMRL